MRMRNNCTGDILELPPPDAFGRSAILLNGKVLHHLLFCDADSSVRLGDGRKINTSEFPSFIVDLLRKGESS